MSLKIELGVVVFTALAGLGVFHEAKPLEPLAPTERHSAFIAEDYAAFDRDFEVKGETCEVGLERRGMCFTSSPLQARIIEGQPVPLNVPLLAAEFPILVALPVKEETQKLLRYGTTLALIDTESRVVEDVLYLDANTFADATGDDQTQMVTKAEDKTVG